MLTTIPGLTNESIEFFVVENEIKFLQNGKICNFNDLPQETIELLKEEMYVEKNVLNALNQMHPNNPEKRLEQFTKCRLGGLDFKADIKDGKIQDGEYWPCPNHGNCPHEGILCKLPTYNDVRLTKQDIELMKLSTTELTNEAIADKMNLAMGTFHKAKKYIHNTLGVQTKQGITLICTHLNLFS